MKLFRLSAPPRPSFLDDTLNDSTHDTATDNRGSKKAKTKMGSATIAGFGPGLSERMVKESRAHHGSNLLTPPQRTPWWRQLLRKFDDPIIRILIIAAVVAIAVGMVDGSYVEGIGIVIAILLATVLAFVNEYKAEREFDLLNKSSDENPVTVLRDGNYTTVPRKDIVVGDLVLVEMGEEIPADGDLLQALSLSINESRLTGESEPVFKYPKDELLEKDEEPAYPFHRLLRGTTVMDGHGLVKITHVGDSSEIGRTARAAAEEHHTPTPLTRQLERLSKLIGVVAFGVATALFTALVARGVLTDEVKMTGSQWAFMGVLFVGVIIAIVPVWFPIVCDYRELRGKEHSHPAWLKGSSLLLWLKSALSGALVVAAGAGILYLTKVLPPEYDTWVSTDVIGEYLRYFMVAVTIIVVAVPEGLPMSVTLSLAYSMRRMAATNNLVRQMHACETIGAATVICSDKTGTLTLNKMRVNDTSFPTGTKSGSEKKANEENKQENAWETRIAEILAESIACNSTANLKRAKKQESEPLGNPTEGALLLWLESTGQDYEAHRAGFGVSDQLAFSSKRKFMATVGHSPVLDKEVVYVKGAPEVLLKKCSGRLTLAGRQPLGPDRQMLEQEMADAQARGMRTLGFALKEDPDEDTDLEGQIYHLTWLGFVSIADPVRPEVPDSIKNCESAGIDVKIVTGDNPKTAQEIARQIGLWSKKNDKSQHLTGPEFSTEDEDTLRGKVCPLKIVSRAKPEDKLRLVKLLKEKRQVVAVTGDGTNDAPALNLADVGLAMGRTGTAVAKEASDIILLDDSFPSIVQAVKWGRSLYKNIQRFIVFQLTINLAALGIALLGPFLGIKLPLTVPQMLWVNLIMDTFAALALATEPPHDEVMLDPPRDPDELILTPAMNRFIIGTGATFLVCFIGLILYLRTHTVTPYALSVFFTLFVLAQFWNLFNARCFGLNQSAFTGILENKGFLLIAAFILFGQILIVQFGGRVFRTVPLSFRDWIFIILGTSSVLWVGEAFRFVKKRTSSSPLSRTAPT